MNTATMSAVEFRVFQILDKMSGKFWGTRTDDLVEVCMVDLNDHTKNVGVVMPRFFADNIMHDCARVVGGSASRELARCAQLEWLPCIWVSSNYALIVRGGV